MFCFVSYVFVAGCWWLTVVGVVVVVLVDDDVVVVVVVFFLRRGGVERGCYYCCHDIHGGLITLCIRVSSISSTRYMINKSGLTIEHS